MNEKITASYGIANTRREAASGQRRTRRVLAVAVSLVALAAVALATVVSTRNAEAARSDRGKTGTLMAAAGPGGRGHQMGGEGPRSDRRPGRGHGPGGPGHMLERLLDPGFIGGLIELTDEQGEKIRKLNLDIRKGEIQRRADRDLAHMELLETLRAHHPDRKAVDALVKRLDDSHAAEMRTKIDAVLELKKVLTEEQHAKLLKALDERPGRRGGDRGPRGRAPMPPAAPAPDEMPEPPMPPDAPDPDDAE
ncbi:MAG: periplasmic heavy metal sensor [Candidatus Schekmanbacteria bacterium]|nr:periplasmic heavy metal sensor [Candidatus Schekmanbacteria bacterium]